MEEAQFQHKSHKRIEPHLREQFTIIVFTIKNHERADIRLGLEAKWNKELPINSSLIKPTCRNQWISTTGRSTHLFCSAHTSQNKQAKPKQNNGMVCWNKDRFLWLHFCYEIRKNFDSATFNRKTTDKMNRTGSGWIWANKKLTK